MYIWQTEGNSRHLHIFTAGDVVHRAGINSSDSCLFGELRMGRQEDVRLNIIAER